MKFIGDLKLLSANLRQNYNKFYNYKGLVSVCYDTSVKILLGADYFFVGNLNIFNKKELMNELKLKNEENEDFGLLYKLIKSKGINQALNEVDGEFSFVFFDSNERNLYLIRDKAGIFPLYYTIYNDNLIFSSFVHDIPKLLNNPAFSERGLFEFIYMNYFYEPDTFYKDIYEIPIGVILKYNIDTKIVEYIKYYDFQFQFNNIKNRVSEEEYAKRLKKKIVKSVGKRIKYGQKNGVLLSGGITDTAYLYFNSFMGRKVKEKFSSSIALKDPVFVKLGFDKLAMEFNVTKNSFNCQFNDVSYIGRIFNLYSLCLYYESLKGVKRKR